MEINYDQRVFIAKANSESGEVSDGTIFEYFQKGKQLTGTYKGGKIKEGQLLGEVRTNGELSFVYQHINIQGETRTGKCVSVPSILENGLVRLEERWEWTGGRMGKGESVIEEIIPVLKKRKYFLLDVFTSKRNGGNQLAVFTNGKYLGGESMQRVAKELNLSETTFILPPDNSQNDFKVRIFTPGKEMPTAGHPTLGTSHVIVNEELISSDKGDGKLLLEQQVGTIPVAIEMTPQGIPGKITMDAPLPAFLDTFDYVKKMAEVLGVAPSAIDTSFPMQVVSCGVPFLIVPMISLEAVGNCKINISALEKHLQGFMSNEILVFTTQTVEETSDVHCRMFAPGLGIVEDPATGSANGPLGCYLVHHEVLASKSVNHFVSEQGFEMDRASYLYITIEKNETEITRVRLGGQSIIVGEGILEIEN